MSAHEGDEAEDERQPLMSSSVRRKGQDGRVEESEVGDDDLGTSVQRQERQEGENDLSSLPSSPGDDPGSDSPLAGGAALHQQHQQHQQHQWQHQQQRQRHQREEEEQEEGEQTPPRFLRDARGAKHWQRIPYPVRRFCRAVAGWCRGPANGQPLRITPLLSGVQELPLRGMDRWLPKAWQRRWLLTAYLCAWVLAFVFVKRGDNAAVEVAGWGEAKMIGCGASYWGRDNACGLDGGDCRPFTAGGFAFRCPANCLHYTPLNPRIVGQDEVVYKPLVVGGGDESGTYRGDSYICGAAIHAGIINNKNGGCGVVSLVGLQAGFASSSQNGIDSVAFDSYFPLSFRFLANAQCTAKDERWSVMTVSLVFSVLLSLFTASPVVLYGSTFTGLFFTVGMATDAPPISSANELLSNIVGKFLPAAFVAWVMFDKVARRTLKGLRAQVEKTVLWLGGCWVGALSNYTLGWIPIQRLNKQDIDQQPGAKAALAIIIIMLVVIVVGQIWALRQEGRLIGKVKLYALFLIGIVVGLLLPGLHLRLHHYIFALLLLPGTSVQTRPALLYQGLLLGLMINGIARWGFDPVLQTTRALRGDGLRGTLMPTVHEPVIRLAEGGSESVSSVTFQWDRPEDVQVYDGISVLVNDVERTRAYFEDGGADEVTYTRNKTVQVPEYFRFAFMSGSMSGDYTRAGTWAADGSWRGMSE